MLRLVSLLHGPSKVRWLTAARWLGAPRGSLALDAGCAFGFGTRFLAREYVTIGVDSSASYIRRATAAAPKPRFTRATIEALPFQDGQFDAVVCLEVLEHLADERQAIGELRRVLKVGGELVLSVPHRGLLTEWDSLNVYQRLTGRRLGFPLEEVSGRATWHRHYLLEDLALLLQGFEIDRVRLSGLGLAELLNLALLELSFGLTGRLASAGLAARLYGKLQLLYFALAIAEDSLPLRRNAYNLMIHARKGA